MAAAGVRRALAFVTSAYGSYSSCRQYLDDIERARAEAGPGAPEIHKLRHFFNHPGFIEPFADATVRAVRSLPAAAPRAGPAGVHRAQRADGDGGGQRPAARRPVPGPAGRGGPARRGPGQPRPPAEHPWQLVYQSRSGPPSQPWLGPDVCDHLTELAAAGAPGAVLVPVGFITDHMEVVHDLDVEAAQRARELGLPLARAATPGTDPRFVSDDHRAGHRAAGRLGDAGRAGLVRPGRGLLPSRLLPVGRPGPARGGFRRARPPAGRAS